MADQLKEGEFTPVSDALCTLGESPVWDERRQELFWVDISEARIWRYAPESGAASHIQLDGTVGCIGLCRSGRLIVANGLDILLLDPESGERKKLHQLGEPDFPCRSNDGRIGPDGAFWVGTVHDVAAPEMKPLASLWRVTAQSCDVVIDGLKCSNGLAFSEDGAVMYHSNSVGKWVKRHEFDPETGAVSPGELICTPDEAEGRPDGGALDVDGVYWSAGVSAGVVNAWSSTGELLSKIPVPALHPTMPCFGGADFRTLFLTSHRKGMDEAAMAAYPASGRVLAMRAERPGFAAPRFDDDSI